jgi:hypothetical protein
VNVIALLQRKQNSWQFTFWCGVVLAATNINAALVKALQISELGRRSSETRGPEPVIIFLTDGKANIAPRTPRSIMSNVKQANTGNSSIFSLALGDGADFPFLKKLSLRNSGFARKIYEASDTALQLTDFYRQVASPLLANVTFSYQPDQVSVRFQAVACWCRMCFVRVARHVSMIHQLSP